MLQQRITTPPNEEDLGNDETLTCNLIDHIIIACCSHYLSRPDIIELLRALQDTNRERTSALIDKFFTKYAHTGFNLPFQRTGIQTTLTCLEKHKSAGKTTSLDYLKTYTDSFVKLLAVENFSRQSTSVRAELLASVAPQFLVLNHKSNLWFYRMASRMLRQKERAPTLAALKRSVASNEIQWLEFTEKFSSGKLAFTDEQDSALEELENSSIFPKTSFFRKFYAILKTNPDLDGQCAQIELFEDTYPEVAEWFFCEEGMLERRDAELRTLTPEQLDFIDFRWQEFDRIVAHIPEFDPEKEPEKAKESDDAINFAWCRDFLEPIYTALPLSWGQKGQFKSIYRDEYAGYEKTKKELASEQLSEPRMLTLYKQSPTVAAAAAAAAGPAVSPAGSAAAKDISSQAVPPTKVTEKESREDPAMQATPAAANRDASKSSAAKRKHHAQDHLTKDGDKADVTPPSSKSQRLAKEKEKAHVPDDVGEEGARLAPRGAGAAAAAANDAAAPIEVIEEDQSDASQQESRSKQTRRKSSRRPPPIDTSGQQPGQCHISPDDYEPSSRHELRGSARKIDQFFPEGWGKFSSDSRLNLTAQDMEFFTTLRQTQLGNGRRTKSESWFKHEVWQKLSRDQRIVFQEYFADDARWSEFLQDLNPNQDATINARIEEILFDAETSGQTVLCSFRAISQQFPTCKTLLDRHYPDIALWLQCEEEMRLFKSAASTDLMQTRYSEKQVPAIETYRRKFESAVFSQTSTDRKKDIDYDDLFFRHFLTPIVRFGHFLPEQLDIILKNYRSRKFAGNLAQIIQSAKLASSTPQSSRGAGAGASTSAGAGAGAAAGSAGASAGDFQIEDLDDVPLGILSERMRAQLAQSSQAKTGAIPATTSPAAEPAEPLNKRTRLETGAKDHQEAAQKAAAVFPTKASFTGADPLNGTGSAAAAAAPHVEGYHQTTLPPAAQLPREQHQGEDKIDDPEKTLSSSDLEERQGVPLAPSRSQPRQQPSGIVSLPGASAPAPSSAHSKKRSHQKITPPTPAIQPAGAAAASGSSDPLPTHSGSAKPTYQPGTRRTVADADSARVESSLSCVAQVQTPAAPAVPETQQQLMQAQAHYQRMQALQQHLQAKHFLSLNAPAAHPPLESQPVEAEISRPAQPPQPDHPSHPAPATRLADKDPPAPRPADSTAPKPGAAAEFRAGAAGASASSASRPIPPSMQPPVSAQAMSAPTPSPTTAQAGAAQALIAPPATLPAGQIAAQSSPTIPADILQEICGNIQSCKTRKSWLTIRQTLVATKDLLETTRCTTPLTLSAIDNLDSAIKYIDTKTSPWSAKFNPLQLLTCALHNLDPQFSPFKPPISEPQGPSNPTCELLQFAKQTLLTIQTSKQWIQVRQSFVSAKDLLETLHTSDTNIQNAISKLNEAIQCINVQTWSTTSNPYPLVEEATKFIDTYLQTLQLQSTQAASPAAAPALLPPGNGMLEQSIDLSTQPPAGAATAPNSAQAGPPTSKTETAHSPIFNPALGPGLFGAALPAPQIAVAASTPQPSAQAQGSFQQPQQTDCGTAPTCAAPQNS